MCRNCIDQTMFGCNRPFQDIKSTFQLYVYFNCYCLLCPLSKQLKSWLNILERSDIIGLLSSSLDEYEIINLNTITSMFNSFMIKKYSDCKDNVKWKLLQWIPPHVRRDTLTFRSQACYGCILISRMITRCAMSIPNDSQIKLPNHIYHRNRSPIYAMTELAVLSEHGISTHTAQYMVTTLWRLKIKAVWDWYQCKYTQEK